MSGTGAETILRRPGRVVVVSPHLDDAALSLGGTIAQLTRRGTEVLVLTVLAGNPALELAAGPSERAWGFETAAAATRHRRREDAAACLVLGAEPIWLDFSDEQHERGGTAAQVAEAARPYLEDADLVLVPGWPLDHPDHADVLDVVAPAVPAGVKLAAYVEQPYASIRAHGRGYRPRTLARAALNTVPPGRARRRIAPPPSDPARPARLSSLAWEPIAVSPSDWERKQRSIECYESQLDWLGRRLLSRIRLYDTLMGGELIGRPEGNQRAA